MPAAIGDKPKRSRVDMVLVAIGQTSGATAAGGSLKVLDIWSTGRDRAQTCRIGNVRHVRPVRTRGAVTSTRPQGDRMEGRSIRSD